MYLFCLLFNHVNGVFPNGTTVEISDKMFVNKVITSKEIDLFDFSIHYKKRLSKGERYGYWFGY